MAQDKIPRNRRDLANILRVKDNKIPETVDEVVNLLNIEEDLRDSVTPYVKIAQATLKKSKKSPDQLTNEWWTSVIPWEPRQKKVRNLSSLGSSDFDARKPLLKISLQQQRTRLSSILKQLKETAIAENTTPIEIAALLLQLIVNEEDNRPVAKVANDMVSGSFSNHTNQLVPVDKALFILDLLEVGRRKYTQLRQTLLGDDIIFPSYSKVADLRNLIILRHSRSLYPDPVKPIGVYTPYSLQVQQTLERILSTADLPTSEDFPLTFRIADGLDGSGCHTIYNQQHTNIRTKNFILSCFKPISIHTGSGKVVWKNISPNSPFSQRPIFLCAAKECEENIRTFMEDMINPETSSIEGGLVIVFLKKEQISLKKEQNLVKNLSENIGKFGEEK